MYKVFICLAACALLWSCSNQKFKVEGRIDGAAGETLYLEHNGILRTTPLDSVKVAKDGSYSLKAVRPEHPDFYRLRIKNKTITFAIDSTEVITIDGDLQHFATGYTVENSYASEQIKDLRVSLIGTNSVVALSMRWTSSRLQMSPCASASARTLARLSSETRISPPVTEPGRS